MNSELECVDVCTRAVDSREYELAVVVAATIRGPDGALRIRRRYEALPRHNDVVDPESIDSNDEYVDRPDTIHVHATYRVPRGGRDEYVSDEHDLWRPADLSSFGSPEAFLDACRSHHLAHIDGAYWSAIREANSRDV